MMKTITAHQKVLACRSGWWGVWDALVSAIKREERLSFPREITVSVRASDNVVLDIVQAGPAGSPSSLQEDRGLPPVRKVRPMPPVKPPRWRDK